jgi:hypothetical protein
MGDVVALGDWTFMAPLSDAELRGIGTPALENLAARIGGQDPGVGAALRLDAIHNELHRRAGRPHQAARHA